MLEGIFETPSLCLKSCKVGARLSHRNDEVDIKHWNSKYASLISDRGLDYVSDIDLSAQGPLHVGVEAS